MAQLAITFLLLMMLLSLCLKSSWSQNTQDSTQDDSIPEGLLVRECFVGEGEGYTCPNASDIQCPPDDNCEWWLGRPGLPGTQVVGPSLDLDETSKFGPYYLVNARKNVIGLVFVMPRGGKP